MEQQYLDPAAIQAYWQLVELNLKAWRPEVSQWLHSEEGADALEKLLALVPCSASIH